MDLVSLLYERILFKNKCGGLGAVILDGGSRTRTICW